MVKGNGNYSPIGSLLKLIVMTNALIIYYANTGIMLE
jgi:hypothetical protein